MFKTISFTIFIAFISSAYGDDYGNTTAKLERVYDGDTIFVNIDNWPPIIGKKIGIRIKGIDTPELTAKDPKVRILAKESKLFVIESIIYGEKLELRNLERDKYFRIVADVYIDNVKLSDRLLMLNLAKPYDGKGPKPKWTSTDFIIFKGINDAEYKNVVD